MESACSRDGSYGKVKIQEADGSSREKKGRDLVVFLFMEAFGLEVEEDLSALATQYWAEGVWIGKWPVEQKEAWMNKAPEVPTWRQVRGPAGAVMCDTRDLGMKWPHRHALIFEGEVRVDMKYVCPNDVKKMLVQRARSVYWKKWPAKHEYEELKEEIWLQEDERRVD